LRDDAGFLKEAIKKGRGVCAHMPTRTKDP